MVITPLPGWLLGRILVRKFHVTSGTYGGVRTEGFWIKDHKPGWYPWTQEQRDSAAAKYGLRKEDYIPEAADIAAFGNYPDAGYLTYGHKDPYENWSNTKFRRNYGELAPIQFHSWGPEMDTRTGIEPMSDLKSLVLFFLSTAAWMCGIYLLTKLSLKNIPQKFYKQFAWDFDRAFPLDDPQRYPLTWYSFELEEDTE